MIFQGREVHHWLVLVSEYPVDFAEAQDTGSYSYGILHLLEKVEGSVPPGQ